MPRELPELHPLTIPGYDGGPYGHRPEVLAERLFWLGHLYSCLHSEDAEDTLFGPDGEDASAFQATIHRSGTWPTFTVPLQNDHRIYVVYRTCEDDPGIDYLIHHPTWEAAEALARDDGHFEGPGLSWRELHAAAYESPSGGSTNDRSARLLLLLPALGDEDLPDGAVTLLASALTTHVEAMVPERAARLLLEGQGAAGRTHWTRDEHGVWTNDGNHSRRSLGGAPPEHLRRMSVALGQ